MKGRILLADDAAFMRMMQKDILEKNGYEVCGEAADGLETVEKFIELLPDILILDITMPNMDGLEVLKQIKKDYPEANVVICSSMCQEDLVVTAMKYGACEFIAKPLSAELFLGVIKAIMEKGTKISKPLSENIVNDWCTEHRNYQKSEKLSQEQINKILESYRQFYSLVSAGNYSSKDKLTGCLHFNVFNADFPIILNEAETKNFDVTITMLDIDNFMHVNNDFGHKTGDDVLKEISNVLTGIDKPHHIYRRGDEFTLIFPNTEKEQVFLIMEEARKRIAAAPECSRTNTTVSIGIATYPEDGTRDVDVIRKADGAMYRAKQAGRNRIALAKEEKLVTKTAHYTIDQLKQLEKLSNTTGVSEAALMREALDELLKKYKS